MVAQYDRKSKDFYLPISLRKVKVSLVYKDWAGSAGKNSIRLDVT